MKFTYLLTISLFFIVSVVNSQVVINAGIGGNSTSNLLSRIDADVIDENPDLVILMVGTNDMLNSKKMMSYEKYSGNLNQIVQKLKDKEIDILLCSPLPVDSIYLFERHDPALFTEGPNVKLNKAAGIMKDIATTNDIHFLDLNKRINEMDIIKHNEDDYIQNEKNSDKRDGVHPTVKGYSLISKLMFDYLKAENLLSSKVKIICFGDSITFGQNVQGAGSASGQTYPAQLFRLIRYSYGPKR